MTEDEKQLLQILKERSFKRGTFRLASGDTSDYYIDGRMTAVHSTGAYLIGEVLYALTKDLAFEAIGGMEVGAVPLTTATVISFYQHGRDMEGFWVRDAAKVHGTQKLVEGNLKPGMRVVVVDDVITKGTSTVKAVHEVRAHGCEVVMVTALLDRLAGAEQLFKEHQIPAYKPVFTIRDLGVGTI